MKCVVVTGAAGFSGTALVESLRSHNIKVFAIVRPGSSHNKRIAGDDGIVLVPADLSEIDRIDCKISCSCDCLFHLAWTGEKGYTEQVKNVDYTLKALEIAKKLGCKRFICTGSQAEYGLVPRDEIMDESRALMPFTSYGSAKVAACVLSRQYAVELNIEWIWGRIFSLIGRYEPRGRMLSDMYYSLRDGQDFVLSSCSQNWDYLDVYDAAEALIALCERGVSGEIYNIAHGEYRQLKSYTEELRDYLISVREGVGRIVYGGKSEPYVSLQPSVEKIQRDTGWRPKRLFLDSVRDYEIGDDY